jgi:site-specific DNA-methyltransferase (adenine-specific)
VTLWQNGGGFSSHHQDWQTPDSFFKSLDDEFLFTLDAAATRESAKCDKYFSPENCGLSQDWSEHVTFVNPPYSEVGQWMKKASVEGRKTTVVALVFARTCTKWFHSYVMGEAYEVRFVRGRLKFERDGVSGPAPAPSMVVIWKPVKRKPRLRVRSMKAPTAHRGI